MNVTDKAIVTLLVIIIILMVAGGVMGWIPLTDIPTE